MNHIKRVAEEFGRQADTFDAWAAKADDAVAARFRTALGAAGAGDVLDVACGPGVVTAAIAAGAANVVGLDATPLMIEKARARCAEAGLANVAFRCGDAENLPFGDGCFDGAVTRFAVHHFAAPQRALDEMFRVLRPGGVVVILDVVSSDDDSQSRLHNAIERLRDPSHMRMLSAAQLEECMARSGFRDIESATWTVGREFEEWMDIINDPARADPVRTVVRALAEAGCTAGIGLSIKDGRVVFHHCWHLARARKPVRIEPLPEERRGRQGQVPDRALSKV